MRSATAVVLLGLLLPGMLRAEPAIAQFSATTVPAVTVVGKGETTVPADLATVQILLSLGDRQLGFSEGDSGGGSFVSASGSTSSDKGDNGDGRRGDKRSKPPSITPEQVDAVVAAVADAASLEPSAIQTHLSPLAARQGEGRARSVRLELEVKQPTPEGLAELLAAASDAAGDNELVVEIAGARYDPTDCAPLEEAAEQAAIADAKVQAERLARLLKVTIGGVAGAASVDLDYAFGSGEEAGCSGQVGSSYDSAYGGLGITVPVFDPADPAEVTVVSSLSISYEIVDRAE